MRGRHRLRWLVLGLAAVALTFVLWPRRPGPTGAWMARAGVEPRFIEGAGWRLRYVRKGQGPTVVLLHGFASSVYSWSELIPALAVDHDVVALDFPGFGGSEVRPDLTAADWMRAVPAVLDGLGLAQVDLIGHSLGGAVASVIAANQPQRVRRLVLIDAAGFNLEPRDRPALVRALAVLPPWMFEILPLQGLSTRAGLRQVFHDHALLTAERVDEYSAPLLRPGSARAIQSLLRSRQDLNVPEAVARIRQPTLVIWGREDRWIPVGQADRFVAVIPGARKTVLEGCGHIPQEERPQETLALIGPWLGR